MSDVMSKQDAYEAWKPKFINSPAWIILGWPPGANAPKGYVELSFSMDWSDDRVNMFWSGKAHSILGEHDIDGEKWARHNFDIVRRQRPDWRIEMFDTLSEDCPVEIDRERWARAMFDGRKYDSRNAAFKMKA